MDTHQVKQVFQLGVAFVHVRGLVGSFAVAQDLEQRELGFTQLFVDDLELVFLSKDQGFQFFLPLFGLAGERPQLGFQLVDLSVQHREDGDVFSRVFLKPVLGLAPVTSVISYLYNLWLPLMYLILLWQIFSLRDGRLRQQYLISFLLAWALLGNALALLFSSAGPCFYGEVVAGADPYAPLMDYLRSAAGEGLKNWSLEAQAYLWTNYQSTGVAVGGGISAMPSLHVAVATLQALLGWRLSRRLGWLLTAYAGVILVGSVHLGWHYAIER